MEVGGRGKDEEAGAGVLSWGGERGSTPGRLREDRDKEPGR